MSQQVTHTTSTSPLDADRQEARAELLAWHTGEPPEVVDKVLAQYQGELFFACRTRDAWRMYTESGLHMRSNLYAEKWREVQP
jgi:hypothetical protein